MRTSSCSFSLQELLQARQAEGVAQADHVLDLRVAVRVGEVAQRALHLADEVVEHRLERRQDLLQLRRRLGGVALEVLGLGEGELQVLGQGPGEVVAAERDRPLPDDPLAVGDDQVGAVGADVEGDDARLLPRPPSSPSAAPRLRRGGAALAEQVVGDVVAQRQRRHLDDVDLDVDVLEVLQVRG